MASGRISDNGAACRGRAEQQRHDRRIDEHHVQERQHDLDRVLRPVRLVVDEDTALGREIGAMAAPSTGSSPRGVAKPETARAAFRARRAAGHY